MSPRTKCNSPKIFSSASHISSVSCLSSHTLAASSMGDIRCSHILCVLSPWSQAICCSDFLYLMGYTNNCWYSFVSLLQLQQGKQCRWASNRIFYASCRLDLWPVNTHWCWTFRKTFYSAFLFLPGTETNWGRTNLFTSRGYLRIPVSGPTSEERSCRTNAEDIPMWKRLSWLFTLPGMCLVSWLQDK